MQRRSREAGAARIRGGEERRQSSGDRRRLGRRPQPGSPPGARFQAVLEPAGPCRSKRVLANWRASGRRGADRRHEAHRTVERLCGSARLRTARFLGRGTARRSDVQCSRAAGEQARLVAGADLPDPELCQQRQQGQESGQSRCREAAATGCHGAHCRTRNRPPDLVPIPSTGFACFAQRRPRCCSATIGSAGLGHGPPPPWSRNVWPARHPRLGKIKNRSRRRACLSTDARVCDVSNQLLASVEVLDSPSTEEMETWLERLSKGAGASPE